MLDTYLALTMFPAFSSTISSNPIAKMSMGLALLSVKKENNHSPVQFIPLKQGVKFYFIMAIAI